MAVTLIIQIINALVSAITSLVPLFESAQDTMSQTDAEAIHAALSKAEAATQLLRPQVDATLSAAAAQR